LEYIGVDGKSTQVGHKETGQDGVDWIDLVQDRDN
jgi:hypothetical protein